MTQVLLLSNTDTSVVQQRSTPPSERRQPPLYHGSTIFNPVDFYLYNFLLYHKFSPFEIEKERVLCEDELYKMDWCAFVKPSESQTFGLFSSILKSPEAFPPPGSIQPAFTSIGTLSRESSENGVKKPVFPEKPDLFSQPSSPALPSISHALDGKTGEKSGLQYCDFPMNSHFDLALDGHADSNSNFDSDKMQPLYQFIILVLLSNPSQFEFDPLNVQLVANAVFRQVQHFTKGLHPSVSSRTSMKNMVSAVCGVLSIGSQMGLESPVSFASIFIEFMIRNSFQRSKQLHFFKS